MRWQNIMGTIISNTRNQQTCLTSFNDRMLIVEHVETNPGEGTTPRLSA